MLNLVVPASVLVCGCSMLQLLVTEQEALDMEAGTKPGLLESVAGEILVLHVLPGKED